MVVAHCALFARFRNGIGFCRRIGSSPVYIRALLGDGISDCAGQYSQQCFDNTNRLPQGSGAKDERTIFHLRIMKSLILKGFDLLNLFSFFNKYTANTATVFMLHGVNTLGDEGGCEMPSERLAGFCSYLKKENYSVISLAEYIEAIRKNQSIYKTVVFTVDDGYRNFYHTYYPIFREFDFPATIFLTTDFIENRTFLWWDKLEYALKKTSNKSIDLVEQGLGHLSLDQRDDRVAALQRIVSHCKSIPDQKRRTLIDELIARLGVDISDGPRGQYEPLRWHEIEEMSKHKIDFYPHTKTHPILSRLSYDQKLSEVGDSKRFLENKLNRPLNIFSYPNGKLEDIDPDTIKALRETGFTVAVTSIPGFNNTQSGNNLFMLHRFAIPENPLWFKQYVSGLEFVKNRLRDLRSLKPFKKISK